MNYRMIFIVLSESQNMNILYFKWDGVPKLKSCGEEHVALPRVSSVSSQESPFSSSSVDLSCGCTDGARTWQVSIRYLKQAGPRLHRL